MSTGHDVMISYQWDSQKRMLKLKDKLTAAGISAWMDVEQMAGNMNDRMAEAVEGSNVILVCFSKKYQGSPNCKKELNYADLKKKRLIPLKYDDHNPSGWLGLLIGSLLYYDVRTDEALDDNFDAIVQDIRRPQGATATVAPTDTTEGATSPKAKTSTTDSGLKKIDDKDIRDVTSKAGLQNDDMVILFVELEIDAPNIERAQRIADTKDFQLQASKVLQTWRKKKGKAASKIVIINALEACKLKDAVEILKDTWKLV
ncbi:uncharacterized protein [Amphiura filiformis]|uniref:uncharacterized protein isoform X2 n=1 Tax=Amphiura filiformis TaxID=82378 RepID=UPI003B20F3F1